MEKDKSGVGSHDIYFESIANIVEMIIKSIFMFLFFLLKSIFKGKNKNKNKNSNYDVVKKYYENKDHG